MPKIELKKSHALARDVLEERVDKLVERLAAKMEQMGMTYRWRKDRSGVDFEGRGFTGKVEIQPAAVAVTVDLSLMLAPFRQMVSDRIEKSMDKYLADQLPG